MLCVMHWWWRQSSIWGQRKFCYNVKSWARSTWNRVNRKDLFNIAWLWSWLSLQCCSGEIITATINECGHRKKFSPLKKSCPIRRHLLENKILEEEKGDTQLSSLTVPKEMRFMKRKRKEERKQKKVDRLWQKSKKMKKVYAQDKKVVKEKIQGERQRRRLTGF